MEGEAKGAKTIRKGGVIMASKMAWEKDLNGALARARSEDRYVLLDFYNPG